MKTTAVLAVVLALDALILLFWLLRSAMCENGANGATGVFRGSMPQPVSPVKCSSTSDPSAFGSLKTQRNQVDAVYQTYANLLSTGGEASTAYITARGAFDTSLNASYNSSTGSILLPLCASFCATGSTYNGSSCVCDAPKTSQLVPGTTASYICT